MNTIGIKARQIRELTEGYKATRIEDKELADEWDTTSGDGIESCKDSP
ncbi:MAG: hypothetical protein ABOK23_02250 [Candidatus Methanoperedens sp.]|nr:hypothetical protein [Candidatus Methanoperedens sp.]MCZ7395339.1 hypothetical protein [Candidatus Methanoperedens sp.]